MSAYSFWHDFIAGWVAGVAGTAVGHPFDTVKVRQQIMNTTMKFAIKATYKNEGVRGYYKGMLFPILTMGPSNSVFFGMYGNCVRFLQGNQDCGRVKDDQEGFLKHVFIAGCVAGFFQTMFTCPVEVVKTVLQANTEGKGNWKKHYIPPYKGMIPAIRGILKERGLIGLYQGLVPLLYRDIPSSGAYMFVYEYLHADALKNLNDLHRACLSGGIAGIYTAVYEYLIKYYWCSLAEISRQGLAGGTAGVVSWMMVIPFDVVKSRIQADNPTQPKYKGMVDCFVKSYKSSGLRIFFMGTTAICIRAFPVNCMTFMFYEKILQFCAKY